MSLPRESGLVLGVVLAALALAQPAQSQYIVDFTEGGHASAGYVAKPSEQLLGLGVAYLPSRLRGWGALLDGRISTDAPSSDEVRDGWEPQDAFDEGHTSFRDHRGWTTLSLSVMRGVSPQLALYVGGSASWRTVHRRFHYEEAVEGEPPRTVVYWVEDEDAEEVEAGVVAGGIIQLRSRIALQVGGQSAPSGFVVGGHVLLF